MTEPIGLTVVLPTLDRGENLRQTIVELLAQNYAPLEILVVDQSEATDPDVVALAEANPGIVSYHHVDFRGLPTARNYGWRHARHDAILFLDDDVHCYPSLLAEHARCLQLPGVGIVAGAVEEARDRGNPVLGLKTGHFHPVTAIPVRGFEVRGEFDVDHAPGGNFSAWRQVFEKCGGIDEIFSVGAALNEETDFCLRARLLGYRVLYSGDARIVHLGVPRGGCRVPVWHEYIWAMAHNRAVLIHRHVRWFYRPLGLCRLLITGAALTVRERNPRLFAACLSGAIRGIADSIRAGCRC